MQTINYLQSALQDIKEFKVITSVHDKENSEINVCVDDLYKDQFVLLATKKGLSRYENSLGLTYKETDTLDDRRFRIITEYSKQLPYTKVTMNKTLENLCGKDGYRLTIDLTSNLLTARIALTAKSQFFTVKEFLESVTPLNLIIDLSLLYNQYKSLHRFTYGQLKEWTHNQLREEVIA